MGHVEVSPTAQGQGAVFVAEGAAAVHGALPNTTFIVTTSEGGAGAAHFEREVPPPGPSGFQFDIVFRVMSTDGTQVLMSDCMTVTFK